MHTKVALMVCTRARGGMRSVVEAYERDGLLQRWGFEMLWTHREGSVPARVGIALSAYLRLLKLLAAKQVSLLHVHAAMRGSFWRKSLFASTARRFGVPTIFHLHGSEMKGFYDSLSTFGRAAVKRSLERAETVIVLSESWRSFVAQIAPRARVEVVNNYVALPAEAAPATPAGEFSILFLGVLGRRKGIYDLLDCWPAVKAAIPAARLLVGGNGEIEQAKARAKALGIVDSVDFLGWIDGSRKTALMQHADVFVLPSYNEGLPMSVLEAMSWRTAVVTTRVGGIPEVISDGHDGMLIEAGDITALAAALICLGNNPELRCHLGSAGRKRVEDSYSSMSILPRLESIYRRLSALAR